MFNTKTHLTALFLSIASLSLAAPTLAADWKPFDKAAFAAAQAAGKPILIDISASWCPTCKAQRPIIDALSEKPAYVGIAYFEVDFDAQKPVVRSFAAQRQSTLIAYRGKDEVARSVADTDPAKLEQVLAAAVKN